MCATRLRLIARRRRTDRLFIRLEMPRPYLLGKKGIGVPNSFDSFHVESTSLKVRLTFPVTAIFTSCDAVEGALRLKPVFIS